MNDARKGSSAFAFRDFRDFRIMTIVRLLFTFAYQIQAVVTGWLIYELTKDPLYLGLVGLFEFVPAVVVALFAGYVVDHGNPFRIYRNVLRLGLLSASILVALVFLADRFPVFGEARLAWIYAACVITGTSRGFASPAMYSIVPRLVPREALPASSAWMSTTFQFSTITGPALGGLLYSWQGPRLAFGTTCALLLVAIACFGFVEEKAGPPREISAEPVVEKLTSGLKFVFRHELLLAALALDLFAVFFGGAIALLPVFASEVLHAGPVGLGLLRAAPAAGALVMSVAMIRRPVTRHAGPLMLAMVVGYGCSMIGFALSKAFWLSALMLALSGAFDSVSMVIRIAIVQLCSPDHMRGRIASVNSIFITSSNELGAFESGLAARLLGTVPSVVFGGAMTILTVLLVAWRAPKLRSMDIARL